MLIVDIHADDVNIDVDQTLKKILVLKNIFKKSVKIVIQVMQVMQVIQVIQVIQDNQIMQARLAHVSRVLSYFAKKCKLSILNTVLDIILQNNLFADYHSGHLFCN